MYSIYCDHWVRHNSSDIKNPTQITPSEGQKLNFTDDNQLSPQGLEYELSVKQSYQRLT